MYLSFLQQLLISISPQRKESDEQIEHGRAGSTSRIILGNGLHKFLIRTSNDGSPHRNHKVLVCTLHNCIHSPLLGCLREVLTHGVVLQSICVVHCGECEYYVLVRKGKLPTCATPYFAHNIATSATRSGALGAKQLVVVITTTHACGCSVVCFRSASSNAARSVRSSSPSNFMGMGIGRNPAV